MADYLYSCDKCGTNTTVTKSMKDASRDEACPKCGGKLARIYTTTSLKFIGAGFHCNDYGD